MFKRSKLSVSIAIATCMSATAANGQRVLEELVVTATKRSESVQDIPIALQALTESTLDDLNVASFDDYIEFLPSAHLGGRGPGQQEIFIRGIALDQNGIIGAEFSPQPTVGFYLDEQAVTMGGRNLDVYVTDVERLEVLAGPQGTLFGASAQAGTFRIITNKPDSSEFSAGIDIDYSNTTGGDDSQSFEGYLNIPIVQDKFAARIAVYNDSQGGYIDNVLGTFTTDPTINPNPNPTLVGLDATHTTVDNSEFVEENFNDAEYTGARLGLKWDINDDWSVLLQHSTQELDVDGVFDYDPSIGELQVSRFADDSLVDEFDLTTWTVEGRIGALDVLYTGGYLNREAEQNIDYIGYNNTGAFIAYYTCLYDGPPRTCLDPNKRWSADITNERISHEVRITTPGENRVRAVAGVFYDEQTTTQAGDFIYAAATDLGFFPNQPIPGSTISDPGVQAINTAFINYLTRDEDQIAVFGEVQFDLTDKLTATLGARYFEIDFSLLGSSSFTNLGPVDTFSGRNLDEIFAGRNPLTQDGTIGKFSLSYTLSDDVLVYGTWSQGFRPGGFNRTAASTSVNAQNLPQFENILIPEEYESDDVTNIEFGWKTTLLDGALRFNGAVYFIDWTDLQIAILDTLNLNFLTFTENVVDAEVKGVELDATWAVSENLTLFAAATYNDTEVVGILNGFDATLAPIGSELPLSPALQYVIRGRYDWSIGNTESYVQAHYSFTDSSFSSLTTLPDRRFEQDSYAIAGVSIGAQFNEKLSGELYIENLTDELSERHINDQDDILRISTNRPRSIGIRFSYDY